MISAKMKLCLILTNILQMHICSDNSVNNNDDVLSCTVTQEGHDSIPNIRKLVEAMHITYQFYFYNIDIDTILMYLQQLNCTNLTGYHLLKSIKTYF